MMTAMVVDEDGRGVTPIGFVIKISAPVEEKRPSAKRNWIEVHRFSENGAPVGATAHFLENECSRRGKTPLRKTQLDPNLSI